MTEQPPRARRCAYLKYGALVSLAFVGCVADEHPEVDDTPPAPEPPRAKERRGPKRYKPRQPSAAVR